jgi:hypothetical protein
MIPCDFCPQTFPDTKIGLAAKTFHELLHNPEDVNK